MKLEGGRIRKCHIDQLRAADVEAPLVGKSVGSSVPESAEVTSPEVDIPTEVQAPPPEPTSAETPSQTEQEDVTVTRKDYPKRVRSQVQRYDPSFS